MWKKVVEWSRPQIIIWHTHIACWIPKATDTHSEYVILIAFPLQQWLQGCSSVLRYTYPACLVLYIFYGRWMREYFSSLFHTICWFFIVGEVNFGRWNVWGRRPMFVFNLSWVKDLWKYCRVAWNDNYSTPTITVFVERDLVYSELRSWAWLSSQDR